MPDPWITGGAALVLGMGVLATPPRWGWAAVAAMAALDAVFLVVVVVFSRRPGWTAVHTFSVAAAGALDYGIRAFAQRPLVGGVTWMRISNTVFLGTAVWLIWLGARRVLGLRRLAS